MVSLRNIQHEESLLWRSCLQLIKREKARSLRPVPALVSPAYSRYRLPELKLVSLSGISSRAFDEEEEEEKEEASRCLKLD